MVNFEKIMPVATFELNPDCSCRARMQVLFLRNFKTLIVQSSTWSVG